MALRPLKPNFALAYVSSGLIHFEFVVGLTDLLRSDIGRTSLVDVYPYKSSPRISVARNNLVQVFLRDGAAEALVFVDTDMAFTANHIARVLEFTREASVVGVNYTGINSRTKQTHQEAALLVAGNRLGQLPPITEDAGLIDVDAVGAGVLAVRRKVFEDVRANYGPPQSWFAETVRGGEVVGTDYEFCLRAREAGHRVVVAAGVRVPHMKTVGIVD